MKIYQPSGKAREYSPLALNIYNGCDHGCKYCYVPNILGQYNKNYRHNQLSVQSFDGLEISCKKISNSELPVLLSFTCDPYCKYNDEQKATRKALEILYRYNIKVSILTKGGKRCLQDLDIFLKFKDRIRVGATLVFDNDKDSLKWETGAALPKERLETLKILHESGINTWASFEPVIYTEQSLNMMEKGLKYIELYKVGKLNNYKNMDKNINWSAFLSNTVKMLRQNNVKFYIKNELRYFAKDVILKPQEYNMDYYNDFGSIKIKSQSLF